MDKYVGNKLSRLIPTMLRFFIDSYQLGHFNCSQEYNHRSNKFYLLYEEIYGFKTFDQQLLIRV